MDSKSSIDGSSGSSGGSGDPDRARQPSALHFLRALSRIRRRGASLARRSRTIRRAAYASMARSAGPGRAWSRALLRQLLVRRRRRRRAGAAPRRERETEGRRGVLLRRLVPGGAAMDECELLEEAADYVRWLRTQVAVMKAVVSSSSSSY